MAKLKIMYEMKLKYPKLLFLFNIIPYLLGTKAICPRWMFSFKIVRDAEPPLFADNSGDYTGP